MRNAVLRGDLRARATSRKVRAMELFYVGTLALLTFLGLAPEVNRVDPTQQASLGLALLGVQIVLVTYFASACAAQEIPVEGERPAVDLVFARFTRRAVVVGKSLASFATIMYWLLLGAPLLLLAARIRQDPMGPLAEVLVLVAVQAWGVAQVAMLYGILVESEFSRTLLHWATLVAVFAATMALPAGAQWANPVIAATRAAAGAFPVAAAVGYGALGLAAGGAAQVALRRFRAA